MNGRSWQYADLNAIAALEAENFSDPWNHRMLADSFLSGVVVATGRIYLVCAF